MSQRARLDVNQLRLRKKLIGWNTFDGIFNESGSAVEQPVLVINQQLRGASPVMRFQVVVDRLLGIAQGLILGGNLRMQLSLGFLAFDLVQFAFEEFPEEIAEFVFISV